MLWFVTNAANMKSGQVASDKVLCHQFYVLVHSVPLVYLFFFVVFCVLVSCSL